MNTLDTEVLMESCTSPLTLKTINKRLSQEGPLLPSRCQSYTEYWRPFVFRLYTIAQLPLIITEYSTEI